MPPFFIKTVAELEESLNAAIAKEKDAKKKMNATNARAMNGMKQKLKKTIRDNEEDVKLLREVSAIAKSSN